MRNSKLVQRIKSQNKLIIQFNKYMFGGKEIIAFNFFNCCQGSELKTYERYNNVMRLIDVVL